MKGMMFFLLSILLKDIYFSYSLYFSIIIYYVSSYKFIYRTEALDNQGIKLFFKK